MVISDLDYYFSQNLPKLYQEFSEKNKKLKEFQEEVIKNTISRNNTLCIMPTGGGKSLIYWLSGLCLQGITIVISPLIALIDEQAKKLQEQGCDVLVIHSGISSSKQYKLIIDFAHRKLNPQFIFVSPEKIATDGFFEYCMKIRKDDIKLIVIDEVHCVSQWGSNFRPFYLRIPNFLENLYLENKPTILGLTATLNSKEIQDISKAFEIKNENIIKDDSLIRDEISLKILKFDTEDEKEKKFWDILKIHKNEKILVYVYRLDTERGVKGFSKKAIEKGFKACCFHGEMSATERSEIIENLKRDKISLIFATSAFGMGIDIPDIRVVIHYMIPESVEQYYQEVGRAARDKKTANAYLLYSNKNIDVKRKYFINSSYPKKEDLEKVFSEVTTNKKGYKTFPYFEKEENSKCLFYYLDSNLIGIICKGFGDFKNFEKVTNQELQKIIESTTTKGFISSIKKTNMPPQEIAELAYKSLIEGTSKLKKGKTLDKRLILDIKAENIKEDNMQLILKSIEEKRKYKNELLDYFVYLINDNPLSNELHQEIGSYLGVDKHKLGLMYSTEKGDKVRSKSEVIIANLFYNHKIEYEYEKKLYYNTNSWIEPDFTIDVGGEKYYFEHLGMLGVESYDKRWLKKKDIYEKYFSGKLIISYESSNLSSEILEIIKKIKTNF